MRTLLILSAQLCYEPKNALYKKKSIFKKKTTTILDGITFVLPNI